MRILWGIFDTKMYIWNTAPSAKINYLDFTMPPVKTDEKSIIAI